MKHLITTAAMMVVAPALGQEGRPPHPLDGKQGYDGTVEEAAQKRCLATYERFRSIKTGMMEHQVRNVMKGCEGEHVSETMIGGTRFSTLQWRGEGYSLMQVMFKDRHVFSINQVGLK